MGGELRVESEVGRGSTFILSLPLGLAAAPEMRSAPGARDEPPGPPLRLLVVDDHEINRRTMVLLLQPSGAEVMAVEGARVALDLLRAEAFDAVLTDINMPEMNGLELARALRSGPGPNRATPVLAVTGGDSADELAACQEAGLAGCVAKPIEVGALYAALEAALAPHEDGLNAGEPRAA
jgi:CheY-like chemotaxis protein